MTKLRVLFVAGLDEAAGGVAGGQGTVARAIFNSPIGEFVEFAPLSTTMRSLPPPPLALRALAALARTLRFTWLLRMNDVALIFSSDGMSLVEKSVMCMIARLSGRGVVLRTSAGALLRQSKQRPAIRFFLRRALACAHVVCSQGPTWTKFFDAFPEAQGKVFETPNALELPHSGHAPVAKQITFVGWMIKAKGIYELLDVMQEVRDKHPDALLNVIGGGGEAQPFAQKVRDRGLDAMVNIHGWLPRSEVFELLRRSAAMLLPSHSEGLPNVVLEAMAVGTPVVTTRVGSLPDLIRDGENGLLAEVGDVATMANHVQSLFESPQLVQKIATNAYVTAERFRVTNVWPQYLELLSRAARAAGREVVQKPEAIAAQSKG
jgi:glycosyltransferase involved in cell wall biosynthesis